MKEALPERQNTPTPAQLARLTAMLSSHAMPSVTGNGSRATVAHWKPPAARALVLWSCCEEVLAKAPAVKRHGLGVEELAVIAATLIHGRDLQAEGCDLFARLALRVWLSSHDELEQCAKLEQYARDTSREVSAPGNKYPVQLTKALRLLMPTKRWDNRWPLFREFLRQRVSHTQIHPGQFQRNDEATVLNRVAAEFDRFKRDGLTEKEYQWLAHAFPGWLADHGKRQRNARARKGGEGKAFKIALKAAEQGKPDALIEVAEMYARGLGAPQDEREALKWYRKAAEGGFVASAIVGPTAPKHGQTGPVRRRNRS